MSKDIKAFKGVEEFIAYLEGTLIPDLNESGKEATAEDFLALVGFLKGGVKVGDWESKDQFVSYLKNTLIPDLKESGSEFTAEDFETGIKFLRKVGVKGAKRVIADWGTDVELIQDWARDFAQRTYNAVKFEDEITKVSQEFAPDDENLDKQYEVIHTFARAFLTEMKKLIGE